MKAGSKISRKGEEYTESIDLNSPTIKWEPKDDITAYELAEAVPILVSGVQGNSRKLVEWIEDLSEDVRRHFVIENG